MKRTLKQLFLSRSPLVLVIAQVRISTILKMEDYVPDIQEALRKKGYPEYKYEEGAEVKINGSQVISKRTQRWFFLNSSNTKAVILSTDFIALSTTEYKQFEDYSLSMDEVLACINEVVGIDSTKRIGLRYIDLVYPDKNETLDQYLQSSILGLSGGEIGVNEHLNKFEFVGQTQVGRLVMSCTQSTDGSILPGNINSENLNIKIDKPAVGEKVCILDFDHSCSETHSFDTSSILELLNELHDNLDRAFRSTVTNHALQKWGMEEVQSAS